VRLVWRKRTWSCADGDCGAGRFTERDERVAAPGRVNATIRFIVWGTLPVGALIVGALGTWLGNRNAIWVAAAVSPLWRLTSPLRRLHHIPETQPAI